MAQNLWFRVVVKGGFVGIHYTCSACGTKTRLTPQSPGFGQMSIPCPSCGEVASYKAQKPYAAKRTSEGDALQLRDALSHGGEAEGPNLTVPLQTPDALLKLDAVETAPTMQVAGLSSGQIRALDKQMGVSAPSTVRMESPLAGVEVPDGGSHTTEQPGLSDEILLRATGSLPILEKAATSRMPSPEELVKLSSMASEDEASASWVISSEDEQFDVSEDRIPTRSVSGLSDRSVKLYASELYTEETQLSRSETDSEDEEELDPSIKRARAEARAKEVVAKAQAALREHWKEEARQAKAASESEIPAVSVPEVEAEASTVLLESPAELAKVDAPVGEKPPHDPTFALGSPLSGLGEAEGFSLRSGEGSANPTFSGDLGASSIDKMRHAETYTGPSDFPGGKSTDLTDRNHIEGAPGPVEGRSQPRSSLRSNNFGVLILGVVFVVVFCTLFGVLYFFFSGKMGAEKEKAPVVLDETERSKRFGWPAINADAPFAVLDATVKLEPAGKGKVRLKLSGEVVNRGEYALDKAEISATVGLLFGKETTTFSMKSKGLTPPTTRKSSWKPRQKRQFMLESDVLPDDKVQKAEGTRFVLIRFEGSNGKAYQFGEPIQVMEF